MNANFKKWSNTLKEFVGKLSANCLSVFYHFMGLALKELNYCLANWWWHKFDDLIQIYIFKILSLTESTTWTWINWLLLLWYEGYQELDNRVGFHCPAQPSLLVEFKPRNFKSHCANILTWKIKNKIYEKYESYCGLLVWSPSSR